MAALRRELLLLGERESRMAAAAARARPADAGGPSLLQRYREETAALRRELAAAAARGDAAVARVEELEAALTARDVALAGLRRAAAEAEERHGARLEAVQDKYITLLHVVRRVEACKLEVAAGCVSPRAPSLAAAGRGARPDLHDADRCRLLLEEGREPDADGP